MTPIEERMRAYIDGWGVSVERVVETAQALVALGNRDRQPVALKVNRASSDEGHSGSVLAAFGGRGVVRLIEQQAGAVLVERLVPGTPLADEVDDDRATAIIAEVIERMAPGPPPPSAAAVGEFARSFERYLGGSVEVIPRNLVRHAHRTYTALCASQGTTRLLHGDLHHDNVLLDDRRGWVAIDPKGVVGEIEYELGAVLRNPVERPDVFASRRVIERRVAHLSRALGLDGERISRWAYAQAVLAALWELEDDGALTAGRDWIRLAEGLAADAGEADDRAHEFGG